MSLAPSFESMLPPGKARLSLIVSDMVMHLKHKKILICQIRIMYTIRDSNPRHPD